MGFKIMGVAFPKWFNTAEQLSGYLGLGTLLEIEVTDFGCADSDSIARDEVYVIKSGQGTLIIMGDDLAIGGHYYESIKGTDYLRFIIDENSNSYMYDFFKDGVLRSFCIAAGTIINDEGKHLSIELGEEDYGEIIFKLIINVTGANYFSIEDDREAICYKISGH